MRCGRFGEGVVVNEFVMAERSVVKALALPVEGVCCVGAVERKSRGIKDVDCGDFGAISICEPFLVVRVIPRVTIFKL